MLRLLIPAVLSATQFLFLPNSSLAQNLMPSNSSCPCTVHGSVVDSVSLQPVPHALVKLSGASFRAALTDSEGKFQFEGLPAGSVTLEAEKPGYLSLDSMGPHLSVPVSVQLALDAPPAILKLVPESVISGQVTDERGEPLEGFTVMIWTRVFNTGVTGAGEVGYGSSFQARTDDEGKFRIARLSPGSYYLLAQPPQGAVQKASFKSAVPSGYAPVFYSGANDLLSANPVKVLPGKSAQANFSLKREPFIRLSGTISGYSPGDQVHLTLRASPGIQDPHIVFEPGNGSFHTDWIPPGAYTLIGIGQANNAALSVGSDGSSQSARMLAVVQLQNSSAHSFASQPINALSSVSDIHLALQPTVDIPAILHGVPFNKPNGPPDLFSFSRLFALIPKTPGASSAEYLPSLENPEDTHYSGDRRMTFTGVPPGTYELRIGLPYNASFYVESATSGAVNLLRENLALSGSIPPINIVLRDDPATLSGTVFSANAPVSGVVVLISDSRGKPTTFVAGPTGAFRISGLAPGAYRVFAVEPALNPDYLDPAFQQKISSRIQEVTLSAKQSASLNLELAAVEE